LWVVVLDVSDMFVVAGLQITSRLAYIRVVACVAFQLVNAWSIVWWGFCFGCCFDYVGKCIVASEGYFYSGSFSRLVTFLICGDEKVNVAHFSFFVGCLG